MSNAPQRPSVRPAVSQEAAADVASIKVETNTSTIQIESNDEVNAYAEPVVESLIEEGYQGIQIETFVGLKSDVEWVASDTAAVIPSDVAFPGDE